MKKNGKRTTLLLLFAFLFSSQLTVNAYDNLLHEAQKDSLNSEFAQKLKTLQPSDVILVWVDIEAWLDRFNDTYLPADPAIYGIRWIMITFDPDVKQNNKFWVLAEVEAGKVQEISKIPWVRNITLIEVDEYVEPPRNPKIVGGLHYAVQRAMHDGNKSLQVIVYVEDQTIQMQREAILGNVTALINQLSGEVLKISPYEDKLIAQIPPQVIENITENSYVSSIYPRGPVVFYGETLSKKQNTERIFYCFANDLTIKLGYFVVLGLIIDSATAIRKVRRRRLTLCVIAILSTVFFSAVLPSAKALDISTETIRATSVWDLGNRGEGVNVAVIDSGIDFNHPDFPSEAIRTSWNVPDNNATLAQDTSGHGTHVAGIIAGRGVNNSLYRGVAWDADLVVVKAVFNEDLEDAVTWIIDNKDQYDIGIISSSVGPSGVPLGGNGTDSPYAIALDDAVDAGIVVVQAAGNSGPNPQTIVSPGNAFNVITVGAVDDQNTQSVNDDTLWPLSSRGPTGDNRTKPDVVAPGVHIISCRAAGTDIRTVWDTYIDDYYVESTGTSFAAPHVSGVAALMLQAHPEWKGKPIFVKSVIKRTTRLNNNLAPLDENQRGTGIVDALQAIHNGIEMPVAPADSSYTDGWGEYYYADANTEDASYELKVGKTLVNGDDSYAIATLKKNFVPNDTITNPVFYFAFHDKGYMDAHMAPYAYTNLNAFLRLWHNGTELSQYNPMIHYVSYSYYSTDCFHEISWTYYGELLEGNTYTIEYGFTAYEHEAWADFFTGDRKIQALWLIRADNYKLTVLVPQAPPEGVNVWVDEDVYTSPVDIMVKVGEHRIEVQEMFLRDVGGTLYIFTFDHWSDDSTDNPRTDNLTTDTTLTAYYKRSKVGIHGIE